MLKLTPILLLLSTCANRMISAEESLGSSRYHVEILRLEKDGARKLCGGGIIHRRYVLTAAQCVYNRTKSDLLVRSTGSPTPPLKLVNQEFRRVAKVSYPLEYANGLHDNDVALVKVIGNFDFGDSRDLKALHLPPVKIDQNKPTNKTAYRIDVARFEEDAFKNLLVVSNGDCQKLLNFNLTEKTFCSKSCGGYPGDPLVYNGYVFGILGVPSNCTDSTSPPQVYTRTSKFVNFIVKTIRNQGFNFIA